MNKDGKMSEELANLYVDGLPWCRVPRSTLEDAIYERAREDFIKLSCSLYKEDAEKAVKWLCARGYNAYIRTGPDREALCDYGGVYDWDEDYYAGEFNWKERWYPDAK